MKHDPPANLQKSYEARLKRLLKSYNQLTQDFEQQKSLWSQEIDELRLSHRSPQHHASSLDERSRQFLNKVSATHNSFAESTIRDLNALRQQIADQDAITQSSEDFKPKLEKLLLEQSRNKPIIHSLTTQMRTVESNIKDLQRSSVAVLNTEDAERTRESELRELKARTKTQERQIADLSSEQDQEREVNRARVEAMEKKLCLIRNERAREREATLIRFEALKEKLSAVSFETHLTPFIISIDREEARRIDLRKQQQQKQVSAHVSRNRIRLTFDSIASSNV